MSNFEQASFSSSSSGALGGAAGLDVSSGLFSQADANRDGTLDRAEFSNWLGGGAGQVGVGVGGVSGGYESSSVSLGGGALGFDAGLVGAGGAGGLSSWESSSYSTGAGLDAGALGLGAGAGAVTLGGGAAGLGGLQASSWEASSGAGYDTSLVGQAAGYTADTNAAWSRYGAEVRGAGLYVDANPQIIRRAAPVGVQTYTQNIRVRFLQPPPVPPHGPLIIREVRPAQPPPPPPLRIRQQAPPLPQPPPLVLRERPPVPPVPQASQTVVRRLAAVPVPPRSVIIERLPAAPPRPRDIVIERWVPYGALAKRRTIVQRAGAARAYAAPRNVIIQYDQPQVRVIRQFQRLGVTLENPQLYVQRYGAILLDAHTLVQQARAAGVVEDISPPFVAGGGASSSFSQGASYGVGGGLAGSELLVAGGDFGGASSSFSSGAVVDSASFGGAGLVASGLEGGFVGGSGLVAGGGLVGGAGLAAGGGSYESSSYSTSAGGLGGFGVSGVGAGGLDVAAAAFNSADANRDGRLDAGEFNRFVQGGL